MIMYSIPNTKLDEIVLSNYYELSLVSVIRSRYPAPLIPKQSGPILHIMPKFYNISSYSSAFLAWGKLSTAVTNVSSPGRSRAGVDDSTSFARPLCFIG